MIEAAIYLTIGMLFGSHQDRYRFSTYDDDRVGPFLLCMLLWPIGLLGIAAMWVMDLALRRHT